MESLQNILKELECPVCSDYMLDEIVLCSEGHSICKKCKEKFDDSHPDCPMCRKPLTGGRNYTLEKIASVCTYPCRHEGCLQVFTLKSLKEHEKNCVYNLQQCPLQFIGCTWEGKMEDLKNHIESKHSDCINDYKIISSKHSVYCATNTQIKVLYNKDDIFIFFSSYTRDIGMYAAMCVGDKKKAQDYLLKINFKDQTGRGYQLSVSAPCIARCKLEDVFNGDKIYFNLTNSMLSKCFQSKMSYVLYADIIKREN